MERVEPVVLNNEAESRFEARVGWRVATLTYHRRDDLMVYVRTAIPPPLEGHGLGDRLARAALEDARAQALTVIPLCSCVSGYIHRHPEFLALVAPEHR